MGDVAGVIAALAALGALFFAWRTVVEARRAHAEDQVDRQLARIEALGVALTELATALEGGGSPGVARGRLIQARASVLWIMSSGHGGDAAREALVTPITTQNADELGKKARYSVEQMLIGLDDYVTQMKFRRRSWLSRSWALRRWPRRIKYER